MKDLIGHRNGRLLVIALTEDKLWLCVCDCKKTKLLTTQRVKVTKSCGCMKTERLKAFNAAKFKSLVGITFGKLNVISIKSFVPVVYNCVCSCGNEIEVPTLTIRSRKSCGCEGKGWDVVHKDKLLEEAYTQDETIGENNDEVF